LNICGPFRVRFVTQSIPLANSDLQVTTVPQKEWMT
jgi:hypothetical protein